MTDERPDEVAPRLAYGLWGDRSFARVSGYQRREGLRYLGVAGHTTTEATGAREAVVTEERPTSDAAWSALVDELRARGRR